jgi:ubiquinone/menaquinone biosynthesis C-methylase UbiE
MELLTKTFEESSGWNKDFLSLLGKRWHLKNKKKILEVGCGEGYWFLEYMSELSTQTEIILSDVSFNYLSSAKTLISKKSDKKVNFVAANTYNLPFSNESFDFITCQRVLMHLADPLLALKEMKRVLKPYGTLAVIEPCSIHRSISHTYRQEHSYYGERLNLVHFHSVAERGKIKLNQGDNSIGETVPKLFRKLNFIDVTTCLNDCIVQILPEEPLEKKNFFVKQIQNWLNQRFYSIWDKNEARNYFQAGGGTNEEFKVFANFIYKLNNTIFSKIKSNQGHITLNDLLYITWGTK